MSKQLRVARQKQISEHNFVNNIFLTTLSTLQSIKLMTEDKHKDHYRHKLFTNYDKVDYSSKSMLELQSQFQTHLTVFRASIKSYLQDFQSQWCPPSNFNTEEATNFILQALNLFNQRNDEISSRLTNDFVQLIQGETEDLFIDHVQIKGNYTQLQKIQHKKSLFLNSMKAQQKMEEEKEYIQNQNLGSIHELRANLNSNHGSPILYRYLIVSKDYYNQYLKGNNGFQVSMIEYQLTQNKQQIIQRLKRCKSSRKNNDIGIELQICNETVFDIQLIK